MNMEDRAAVEELYKWVREGGDRRSLVMVGPCIETGWIVTLSEGSKRRTRTGKDFHAVAVQLLEEFK